MTTEYILLLWVVKMGGGPPMEVSHKFGALIECERALSAWKEHDSNKGLCIPISSYSDDISLTWECDNSIGTTDTIIENFINPEFNDWNEGAK